MRHEKKIPIELLAPARDARIAIEAINHGADAVYMGAPMFGARAAATNSIDDVSAVCRHAHQFNAHVYATVNTLIYDNELSAAEKMIWRLWEVGVDALIVQDLGVLRMELPPIALHASTQCDIRTPEKARFLESLGFSQLVLARELTLSEIAQIRQSVSVTLEAFVHGALCVCYSGRCQLSQAAKRRSANRGECAQMCRLPYDLLDCEGNVLIRQKHLLSLRDLNRSHQLQAMIEAGVSSFKIEGRLKDMNYVKNVVAYYRQALDRAIDNSQDSLVRSSCGCSEQYFKPDLNRSFNRSFTDYFLERRHPKDNERMVSTDTPKSLGQYVGKLVRANGIEWFIDTKVRIANGDGLSYMAPDGSFAGVRVNVSNGNRIIVRSKMPVSQGVDVYRTYDKNMDDALSRQSAVRHILIEATLRRVGERRLALTLHDERGNVVSHAVDDVDLQPAHSPQGQRQRDELAKLGGTIYVLRNARTLPDVFIPASTLARLRRETVKLLDEAHTVRYVRPGRRAEDKDAPCFTDRLVDTDNIANRKAERVFRDHGVARIVPALECTMENSADESVVEGHEVMHTRYCLRRELGACLRTADAGKLPSELFLRAGNVVLAVHCDCAHCEMHLRLKGKK